MGAQTSHSLISARALVSSQSGDALELARGLFAAAMGLSGSPALRSQLTDSSRDLAPRHALADQAFASLSTDVKKLVGDAVALRWSRAEDLQAGLEEMAIRLCGDATSGSIDLVGELLAVSDLVHRDGDVELALGSKQWVRSFAPRCLRPRKQFVNIWLPTLVDAALEPCLRIQRRWLLSNRAWVWPWCGPRNL
jgi:hypothetical protein